MNIQEMVTVTKSLIDDYNEDKLLEVVKEYKKVLDTNDIKINLWFDAIEETIERLVKKETTIESILKETAYLIEEHEEWLQKFRKSGEITYRSALGAPIFLLQCVYIYKSEGFNGDIWYFDNDEFMEAMKGGEQ